MKALTMLLPLPTVAVPFQTPLAYAKKPKTLDATECYLPVTRMSRQWLRHYVEGVTAADQTTTSRVSHGIFTVKVRVGSRDRGGTVVKVLRYKSEGRWFDSR